MSTRTKLGENAGEWSCDHVMHCGQCDRGFKYLVAGQKHEAKCKGPTGRLRKGPL